MDTINIEILEDGTLKMDTGLISGPNHMSAEALVRDAVLDAGGKVERKRKPHQHGHHHHHHGHTHEH
jgi:hypothetical protein